MKSRLLISAAGAAGILALTAIGVVSGLTFTSVGYLYLLVVVLIALRAGFTVATGASLIAIGCLDYYFLPPLHSFRLDDPQSWVALATFEFTGLLVSRLSIRAQEHARVADRQKERTERLFDLTRKILLLDVHEKPAPHIASAIAETIGAEDVCFFDPLGSLECTGSALMQQTAQEAWNRGAPVDDPLNHRWARLLESGAGPMGAICIAGRNLDALMADAIASVAAMAIERSRSLEREAIAEAASRSEQLRATVLDSLAHTFKTPLTAILTSTAGIVDGTAQPGRERELVELIDREARQLNDLTTRLLRTARLDATDVNLKPATCTLSELVESVLAPFSTRLNGHPIEIRFSPENDVDASETSVLVDPELLSVALQQLVDNAIKYSTPLTPIRVRAGVHNGELRVSVHNMGEPVPMEDREHIFERFYRSRENRHRASGTGLGLSITRKIVEAHGGRVRVTGDALQGTTFEIAVPASGGKAGAQ